MLIFFFLNLHLTTYDLLVSSLNMTILAHNFNPVTNSEVCHGNSKDRLVCANQIRLRNIGVDPCNPKITVTIHILYHHLRVGLRI